MMFNFVLFLIIISQCVAEYEDEESKINSLLNNSLNETYGNIERTLYNSPLKDSIKFFKSLNNSNSSYIRKNFFRYLFNPYWKPIPTQSRNNMTCTNKVEYNCTKRVRVSYRGWCWFFACIKYKIETVKTTCFKEVKVCCEGYSVGPSGYCEKTRDWGCGSPWLLTERNGVLTSPGYPSTYKSDLKCQWRIRGPPGTRIIIKMVDLDLETPIDACNLDKGDCFDLCLFDALKLNDTRLNSTKTLCGRYRPTNPQIITGNSLDIFFQSDGSRGGRGFKLVYSSVTTRTLSPLRNCAFGQTWKLCRKKCLVTCDTYRIQQRKSVPVCLPSEGLTPRMSRADIICVPGCECPDNRPIFDNGRCISIVECSETDFKCGQPLFRNESKKILGEVLPEIYTISCIEFMYHRRCDVIRWGVAVDGTDHDQYTQS